MFIFGAPFPVQLRPDIIIIIVAPCDYIIERVELQPQIAMMATMRSMIAHSLVDAVLSPAGRPDCGQPAV